jgi:hypothetical protein
MFGLAVIALTLAIAAPDALSAIIDALLNIFLYAVCIALAAVAILAVLWLGAVALAVIFGVAA